MRTQPSFLNVCCLVCGGSSYRKTRSTHGFQRSSVALRPDQVTRDLPGSTFHVSGPVTQALSSAGKRQGGSDGSTLIMVQFNSLWFKTSRNQQRGWIRIDWNEVPPVTSLKQGAGVNHGSRFSRTGPNEFGPDFQMPSRSARPMYPPAGLTFVLLWQAKRATTAVPDHELLAYPFIRS